MKKVLFLALLAVLGVAFAQSASAVARPRPIIIVFPPSEDPIPIQSAK